MSKEAFDKIAAGVNDAIAVSLGASPLIINILWEALREKNYPKSVKEELLGVIRGLERLHDLEPRRYNHG